MHTKDQLGLDGEDYAARYLVGAGFTIVHRNWRCDEGEIDILAAEAGELVVVEVKTRSGTTYGAPYEAVDWRKAAKLRGLGARWLRENQWRGRGVRFDVISILMPKHGRTELQHIRSAF